MAAGPGSNRHVCRTRCQSGRQRLCSTAAATALDINTVAPPVGPGRGKTAAPESLLRVTKEGVRAGPGADGEGGGEKGAKERSSTSRRPRSMRAGRVPWMRASDETHRLVLPAVGAAGERHEETGGEGGDQRQRG